MILSEEESIVHAIKALKSLISDLILPKYIVFCDRNFADDGGIMVGKLDNL